MNMHRQMHGGGCASCHGVDREGGRLMPRFWIKAPALTKAALTSSGGHKHGKNAAQNHEIYDEKSLREAVINGINPAGEPLDGAMPRWIMAEEDLRDLTSYLLSLPE